MGLVAKLSRSLARRFRPDVFMARDDLDDGAPVLSDAEANFRIRFGAIVVLPPESLR